jgi:hypothetical protein
MAETEISDTLFHYMSDLKTSYSTIHPFDPAQAAHEYTPTPLSDIMQIKGSLYFTIPATGKGVVSCNDRFVCIAVGNRIWVREGEVDDVISDHMGNVLYLTIKHNLLAAVYDDDYLIIRDLDKKEVTMKVEGVFGKPIWIDAKTVSVISENKVLILSMKRTSK